ncbi:MAG: stage III sporulation protein J [Firmicutes bacterium HGW-Firmicutes-20]|jgi:YidC/Oxa1 family membrane protein insertase|nr:YidC/Oxa1 family membrane protein insertase [Erysipelotrichaceae bacterium]PKM63805.1 MAG: stage III sporulation protein J [Firmicutes bacterium HGW-Firmicutes-20]PKM89798.1 MAG: stage III sporulation protein J [Firmicutes bacterium HGW-Firmicutes-10]
MNVFKKRKTLIGGGALLLFLSGCTSVLDKNGNVLPDKIISSTTTLAEIWANESWFSALFVFPLAKAINFLQPYIGIALAIAAVTIFIKLITLTFTIKSTVATQKMQVLQPELNKIQKKYEGKKDDQSRMAMGQEMQALYSKHNVNPLGTILVTFIQLPIILAMWQAVQRSESVLNGTLFGASLKVTPMTGFLEMNFIYIIIFLLMGAFQFASMMLPQYLAKKASKKRPGDKPAPNSQKGMMYGMFAMIMFISINWPTAMSLYWLVSAFAQVVQTLFIQWKYIDTPVGAK